MSWVVRVLLVQYAGDFRELYSSVGAGKSSYHGHDYLLAQLESLQRSGVQVAVLTCIGREAYDVTLPNGIRVMGAAAHPLRQFWRITRRMSQFSPTHLVIQGPMPFLIAWGLARRLHIGVMMANSFELPRRTLLLKYGGLRTALNRSRVQWVGNHGANACLSTINYGVPPGKVIAWDWPHLRTPDQTTPKRRPQGVPTLLFVGMLIEPKGLGDLIRAIAELRTRGERVELQVAGTGELGYFKNLATRLDVRDQVEFRGQLSNDEVYASMTRAGAVVVPSRHSYPEGLPLTIYEALSSRTPLIASDHPMFRGHLRDRETALVFPQGDAQALADRITEVFADDALYLRLSLNSADTWQRLQNPTKWGDILRHWLTDSDSGESWLACHHFYSQLSSDGLSFRQGPEAP